MLWRRSYDVPPPPIAADNEYSQAGDPRYAGLGADMPDTECLKDVVARMMPYWENEIQADLRAGQVVLVAAHGNSLRALVKHLDGISDDDIAGLNIPTGMPLVYELDDDFQPVRPAARTSTPKPPPRPPRRWPTRVAERRSDARAHSGSTRESSGCSSFGRPPSPAYVGQLRRRCRVLPGHQVDDPVATETAWSANRS